MEKNAHTNGIHNKEKCTKIIHRMNQRGELKNEKCISWRKTESVVLCCGVVRKNQPKSLIFK